VTAGGYTPGWSSSASGFMARRSAATHAGAILGHLRPGMDLLDLGCGPGSITVGLARAVAPGRVIGVDREESQIVLARARAAAEGPPSLELVVAAATDLPLPDACVDAAFAHALMEHLPDPVPALAQMRRVLRPGGVAVAVSPDWGGFLLAPEEPPVERAIACYAAIQASAGGDVHAGRRLGAAMLRAGFADVTLSARYEVYDDRTAIAGYLADRLAESPGREGDAARGGVDADEVVALAGALRDWSLREPGMFAQAWVAATGWAPGQSTR
jgi:SAM-dependent methyltransferase